MHEACGHTLSPAVISRLDVCPETQVSHGSALLTPQNSLQFVTHITVCGDMGVNRHDTGNQLPYLSQECLGVLSPQNPLPTNVGVWDPEFSEDRSNVKLRCVCEALCILLSPPFNRRCRSSSKQLLVFWKALFSNGMFLSKNL
jgi:hypothetical protein